MKVAGQGRPVPSMHAELMKLWQLLKSATGSAACCNYHAAQSSLWSPLTLQLSAAEVQRLCDDVAGCKPASQRLPCLLQSCNLLLLLSLLNANSDLWGSCVHYMPGTGT